MIYALAFNLQCISLMQVCDFKSCMLLLSAVRCSTAQSALVRRVCATPKDTPLAGKLLQVRTGPNSLQEVRKTGKRGNGLLGKQVKTKKSKGKAASA